MPCSMRWKKSRPSKWEGRGFPKDRVENIADRQPVVCIRNCQHRALFRYGNFRSINILASNNKSQEIAADSRIQAHGLLGFRTAGLGGDADDVHVCYPLRGDADLLVVFLRGHPSELGRCEDKRFCVHLRIVDGYRHIQVIVVDACVALLDKGLGAVGIPAWIKPAPVVASGRIDYQSVVPIPVAYRISVPA